jgi:hypothetical protein
VITFDEPRTAERVIHQVRALHTTIPILVRTRDDAHYEAPIGRFNITTTTWRSWCQATRGFIVAGSKPE